MKLRGRRLALLVPVAAFTCAPALAQIFPPGSPFGGSLVTSVGAPTDLAFLPDTRMLITTQGGDLRVYCPNNALPGCSAVLAGGGLLTTPAITITPLCTNSEQGLLGVAVDPSFVSNSYVFLFYTLDTVAGCRNRVSRFVYDGTNNTLGSEQVLIDNMPSPNGNHNAGDLDFGKDGYLYVTIGEGGVNAAARLENVLTGKVLRITRDGGIPARNPWASTPDADRCNVTGMTTVGRRCQETFAWGFRNPFRFAFDPNATDTRFFVNDVGQNAYEEIDEVVAGADYGWNCREGTHANPGGCALLPGMVDPVFEYGRLAGDGVPVADCRAITGGAFVPSGVWPAAFGNQYLFADYTCGEVFQMGASGPYPSDATRFLGGGFGGITNLRFGPFQNTQALYYTTYSGSGQVRRIIHNFPRAVLTAPQTQGPAGTTVSFDGSGSADPNGLTLDYLWDYDGNGTTDNTTTVPAATFTYNVEGSYNAALRVRNSNNQTSDPAILRIDVGNPPTATIHSPLAGDRFRVGQVVTLRGSGVDGSTGLALPLASLAWTVLRHHDTHTHPWVLATVGAACPAPNQAQSCLDFTTPAPEDLAAAANSYLEIQLQGTGGNNLSRTASLDFQPNKVTLNFATDPAALSLKVDGTSYTTPLAVTSWESYLLTAEATAQPQPNGQTYVFSAWADGPTANPRTITTPAAAASYTARFRDDGLTQRRFHTLTPCRLIDTRGTAAPIGGPALDSGATRVFVLTGKCGIPVGVRAVAANLTVVGPAQAGDLRLFPTGGTGNTSSINFSTSQVRANNALVSLDPSGQLSVTCAMAAPGGSTHFLLDVVGYFE